MRTAHLVRASLAALPSCAALLILLIQTPALPASRPRPELEVGELVFTDSKGQPAYRIAVAQDGRLTIQAVQSGVTSLVLLSNSKMSEARIGVSDGGASIRLKSVKSGGAESLVRLGTPADDDPQLFLSSVAKPGDPKNNLKYAILTPDKLQLTNDEISDHIILDCEPPEEPGSITPKCYGWMAGRTLWSLPR